MIKDYNIQAFFALLRAGLWGDRNLDMRIDGTSEWQEVYRLATEQSVLGLVLAGLEQYKNLNADLDLNIPKVLLLQWIGEVQIIEKQNKEMNAFVADLIDKLRKNGIYTLLVKGQGVAQCYEKPLWRVSGDVDLLLNDENYQKAKECLIPLSEITESEDVAKKHLALKLNGFEVELHGKMPFGISCRADDVVDEVLENSLINGGVSKWSVDETDVFMPNPDNHILIVFTHFLRHFFIEGVGLRQICDWCRLLYTYRDSLNHGLLESRIKTMGLVTEWKAFYNLASRFLGMPDLGGELMTCDSRFDKRADRIMEYVLESGNFGHNRDVSYRAKNSAAVVNTITLWRRICDFAKFTRVFPLDSTKFFGQYLWNRMLYR